MTRRRAALYRLYPTRQQAAFLNQVVGACRLVYNLALEQRRDWYRPGRRFNSVTQGREIKDLRKEFDWIAALPIQVLHQALRDLDTAYENWWSGRAGRPSFRKKGINDSFRLHDHRYLKISRVGRYTGTMRLG